MKNLFLLLLCLIICSCNTEKKTPPTPPPNIVLIMTDDHAQKAISAYSKELIQTPNIDRIAKEGVLFENSFVTNSICAPSRAVMLTGKYSHLNGLRDNLDSFDTDQMIFPKLLQKAGYFTSIVGKWHLKNLPKGFDYWKILPGQGDYYNPKFIQMNGDTIEQTGYSTDLITDEAIAAINMRKEGQPFCLLYHHKAPHRNWMPNTKHIGEFADRKFPLPKTFEDHKSGYASRKDASRMQDMEVRNMFLSSDMKLHPEYFGEETGTGGLSTFNPVNNWTRLHGNLTPEQKEKWDAYYQPINESFRESKPEGKALDEWKFQRYMEDYLGCITSVDENVGRLLDYLEENGLTENTIIIYTSDQGFYLGEHGWYDKRFMYEQSLRTPLVMKFPERVKANQKVSEMVLNLDLAPTILDFANVETPAEMQGMSWRGLVDGTGKDKWRNSIYYHYYQAAAWHKVPRHYGVRTDRYKLMNFYELEDGWELYDLQNDPEEVNNIYDDPAFAKLRTEMKVKLDVLQQHYKVEL